MLQRGVDKQVLQARSACNLRRALEKVLRDCAYYCGKLEALCDDRNRVASYERLESSPACGIMDECGRGGEYMRWFLVHGNLHDSFTRGANESENPA